jgi:hypothetical protein
MNFPKKLKIGSMTYNIVFPAIFPTKPGYRGMHKGHSGIIEVVDTDNEKLNWKILMHELIHAIDFVFCDRFFNEFETELISNVVISLAIDNKSLFSSNKIPKNVRIFGISYDVVENYEFPESQDTAAYIDHGNNVIYLGDPKAFNMSQDYLKLQFFYCVTEIIPVSIFSNYDEKLSNEFPVSQFSNGLLEVFKDYNFEKALKEVFLK